MFIDDRDHVAQCGQRFAKLPIHQRCQEVRDEHPRHEQSHKQRNKNCKIDNETHGHAFMIAAHG